MQNYIFFHVCNILERKHAQLLQYMLINTNFGAYKNACLDKNVIQHLPYLIVKIPTSQYICLTKYGFTHAKHVFSKYAKQYYP